MTMRLIKPILFTVLCCSLITSCDPSVDYDQIIENRSDFDLWLKNEQDPTSDSMLIPSMEETIIAGWHGLGSPSQYQLCDNYSWIDLILHVKDHDTLHVQIDVTDPTIWTYTLLDDKGHGSGVCECRLIISNADIR